jgi:hypothetical protein
LVLHELMCLLCFFAVEKKPSTTEIVDGFGELLGLACG